MPWVILSALGCLMQTHMVPIPDLVWNGYRSEANGVLGIGRASGPLRVYLGSQLEQGFSQMLPLLLYPALPTMIHPSLSQSAFAEERCVCREECNL